MDLLIRNERKNEYRKVEELTRDAFWNLYVPGCSEHYLLHEMRSSSDFIPALDFVAENEGQIVGNIVYTRGKIVGKRSHDVICFGPISVLPDYQRQGVGSALIKQTFEKAKEMGFTAVCIYGDPRYYHRFGFRCGEKFDITTGEGKFAVALLAVELVPGFLKNKSGKFIESSIYQVDDAAVQEFDKSFPARDKSLMPSQMEFRVLASLVY
jgi:putative acetyltransferase